MQVCIVKESFKYLGVNAEPDKVDDDWLAQFGAIVVHFWVKSKNNRRIRYIVFNRWCNKWQALIRLKKEE